MWINVFKQQRLRFFSGGLLVIDFKDKIKGLISKFTQNSSSVFSDIIISEAGEAGIGEEYVNKSIKTLKDENFISEPIPGVLKRF